MSAISPLIIYSVHSGRLYGTERMALATLGELKRVHQDGMRTRVLLLAPPGPIHAFAIELGIPTTTVRSLGQFARIVFRLRRLSGRLAFILTETRQSLLLELMRPLLRSSLSHCHVVHGGIDEASSYGHKYFLSMVNRLGKQRISFSAVSPFVAERLQAHGVARYDITVINNFLAPRQAKLLLSLQRKQALPLRRILSIGRLEDTKQHALAILAMGMLNNPNLELTIIGEGSQRVNLEALAAEHGVRLKLPGYCDDPEQFMVESDLFLHSNGQEPFGLVILEALHAGLPVLVPDRGGCAPFIKEGTTGWNFKSGSAAALANKLRHIMALAPNHRERIAIAGRASTGRWSPFNAVPAWRSILSLSPVTPPLKPILGRYNAIT